MASHPKRLHTPSEYLAMEREASYKSEFCAGEIFALAGASREQNIIVANLTTSLNTQLEDTDCEVYPGDMRVKTPDTTFYTYPDLIVVCGSPRFEDDLADTLLNPVLIVEVLSPSTETYDRTRKFADYRKIESLREYVLISQEEPRVTQYGKQPTGSWLFREASGLSDVVNLASINCELALEKIYRKVRFPSPDADNTGEDARS